MTEEPVEVIQADREAAVGLWNELGYRRTNPPPVFSEAFARHRLSHSAEKQVLIKALEPFADLADFYDSCEQHPDGCPPDLLVGEIVDLTVGDFRRARSTLLSMRNNGNG